MYKNNKKKNSGNQISNKQASSITIDSDNQVKNKDLKNEDSTQQAKVMRWGLLALLFYALYLSFNLIQPFLNTIIFSIVFAGAFHPIYSKLKDKLSGPEGFKESFAAIIVVLGMFFLIGIPAILFIRSFVMQATVSISAITEWLNSNDVQQELLNLWEPLVAFVEEHYPFIDLKSINLHESLIEISRQTGQYLLQAGSALFRNTTIFIIHLMLLLFMLFFLLKDGSRMVRAVKYLSPLKAEQGDKILHNLRQVSKAVLLDGFLVASLQGLAGGIGLSMVGVPGLFWGTVMGFAALIPVVGISLVWLPVATYLAFTGEWVTASLFALYNLAFVSSIDTVLRPYLMKGVMNASIFFIFVSILGGVNLFGIVGLLYGPMILTFTTVMLRIYTDEFSEFLNHDK
ncbi:AI-2E family transporter [Desulfovibrio litoralis]|uniref:Predicted PurR-regulated permease PerM n=1 Tax=Desulfovibrio litoralis DSM 11393 TaxID=1121455 RepID=A0A1M7SAA9_9BACT|nr:AI-2E family transporter [Desulfovibrio litoralis]SHN55519.1 Predicted PurR-regulated permease PerM [Desulfovibrio litoralis DSM 11393]